MGLIICMFVLFIKSKFHENKDWNSRASPAADQSRAHQEQVPRKQGSKQSILKFLPVVLPSSRASSTKTRIETENFLARNSAAFRHQEQVPRKQGLKLKYKRLDNKKDNHQEQVPRKQGLKPLTAAYPAIEMCTSRASSTKTRIETRRIQKHFINKLPIKSKFHENKDWNDLIYLPLTSSSPIKSKFHENKDWNSIIGSPYNETIIIKSKFHENKDWNYIPEEEIIKVSISMLNIKRKFHENKDWNSPEAESSEPVTWSSRASSTKTRIETLRGARGYQDGPPHQEQVPRKQGLKHKLWTPYRVI